MAWSGLILIWTKPPGALITSQSDRIVGPDGSGAAPAVDLKIRQFQVVFAVAVANQAYLRPTAEALLKIVAVQRLGARGLERIVFERHSFDERLISAADPVEDDEIGRGRPSRTITRRTAAHVAVAGTRRRSAIVRRRLFPVARRQAASCRLILAQRAADVIATTKTAPITVPNKLRVFIVFHPNAARHLEVAPCNLHRPHNRRVALDNRSARRERHSHRRSETSLP